MTTLGSIKYQVNKLAKQINAPRNVLPTFGTSKHDGTPHIEIDGEGYRYLVLDRGMTVTNLQTNDLQELLFLVFQDITFSMGIFYELARRNPNVDSRRLIFHHQLELLENLNLHWKERRQKSIEETLRLNPYKDEAR